MKNTNKNKRNENRKNYAISFVEIVQAQKRQYEKLSAYALKRESYFIAEYYENLSKEVGR